MNKFSTALFLGILLAFSGCLGIGDDEDTQTGEQVVPEEQIQTVTTDGISMHKPESWDFISRKNSPADFPPNVLMLMSAVEPWGMGDIFATVSVAREEIPQGTSSRKYIEAAIQKTKREVIAYEDRGEEEVEIDGQNAKLLVFWGKNKPEDDVLEWQHVFFTKDDYGYVVSSAGPTDSSEENKQLLRDIVLSLTFTQ